MLEGVAAARAVLDVVTGELAQLVRPGRRSVRGGSSRHGWCQSFERLPTCVVGRSGVQAVMTNLVEAIGEDVLHESAQELDWSQAQRLAVFGAEDHGVLAHKDETAVGDTN